MQDYYKYGDSVKIKAIKANNNVDIKACVT